VYNLTWAIVLAPLGAAMMAYLPETPRRAAYITILGTAASLVLSIIVLVYRLGHIDNNPYQALITFWTIQPVGQVGPGFVADFHPQVGILVDGLSAAIMPVVALVSLLVQVYSLGYMRGDAGYRRFFATISLFTFAMLGLVASPNFFIFYFMWEGVGVCSYLLIGHWWQKPEAAAAAKKAFLVTRIGDLGLLLAIIFGFSKFAAHVASLPGTPGQEVNDPFNFYLLADEWHKAHAGLVPGVGTRTLVILAVLVLIGAIGKSAQLPLSTWLPDAMEGPTPISALIHAATMVAAGVYLLARTYPLFLEAPHVLTAVAIIGAATAVYGAVVALAHTDIKRIIAYSTISHLGLMFTALGVGAYSAAVFHLFTHAWFKALLFLAAGSVIKAYGTQDIREMGGAWRRMRTTSWAMLFGVCSAAGVIFFAGFWSKDSIVNGILRNEFPNGGHVSGAVKGLLIVAVSVVSLLGAMYPFRMFFKVFGGEPARRRGFRPERVRDSGPSMLIPSVILAALSLIAGFVGIEGARYTFAKFVHAAGQNVNEGFAFGGVLLGGSLALLGVGIAYLVYGRHVPVLEAVRERMAALGRVAAEGFYLDAAYAWAVDRLVVRPAALFPRIDTEVTDAVADGAVQSAGAAALTVRRLQSGRLQLYTLRAVVGVGLLAVGVTLAATGHFPGVGGSR
jgi:NADH-quinone oxidoreductase subunit L